MSTTAKARKGDLILVEDISRNSWSVAAREEAKNAGRTLPDTETRYQFGIVDSATREGEVKTWRQLSGGEALVSTGYAQPMGQSRRWVLSAKQIDVTGVLKAAQAHHWPGHPDSPRPFNSYEQAREVARPFLAVAVKN